MRPINALGGASRNSSIPASPQSQCTTHAPQRTSYDRNTPPTSECVFCHRTSGATTYSEGVDQVSRAFCPMGAWRLVATHKLVLRRVGERPHCEVRSRRATRPTRSLHLLFSSACDRTLVPQTICETEAPENVKTKFPTYYEEDRVPPELCVPKP